jgi:aromatic ring hydroxylase
MLNLISDLVARDFGGYQAVLAGHAEGSLEAEKMMVLRSYDSGRARAYARALAGLEPVSVAA